MLVLSRSLGESIWIGADIELVLLDTNICLPGTQRRIYDSVRMLVKRGDVSSKVEMSLDGNYFPRSIHPRSDTEVAILEVRPSRVRIGISSPRSVHIRRGELPDDGRYGCHPAPVDGVDK